MYHYDSNQNFYCAFGKIQVLSTLSPLTYTSPIVRTTDIFQNWVFLTLIHFISFFKRIYLLYLSVADYSQFPRIQGFLRVVKSPNIYLSPKSPCSSAVIPEIISIDRFYSAKSNWSWTCRKNVQRFFYFCAAFLRYCRFIKYQEHINYFSSTSTFWGIQKRLIYYLRLCL